MRRQNLIVPVMGCPLFLLLTCAYSVEPVLAVREWLKLVLAFALYILVSRGEDDRGTLSTTMLGLYGGAILAGLIGISQLLGWIPARTIQGLPRIDGGFEHPNYFAMFLVAVALALLHLGLSLTGKRERILSGIVLVGILILLIFTFSRTGWIVFAGSLALSSLLARRRVLTGLAVVALLGAISWDYASPLVIERLQPDDAYYSRFKLIEMGLVTWSERPLLGHGLAAFGVLSQDSLGTVAEHYGIPVGLAPHNDLIRFAVEGGLAGLALYSLLLLCVLRLGLLLRRQGGGRPLGDYLVTLTVAVAAFGLADAGFSYGGPYLLTVAGAAEVALRRAMADRVT